MLTRIWDVVICTGFVCVFAYGVIAVISQICIDMGR